MKIKLNNICWIDRHGDDICPKDMNLKGLPASYVLELGEEETRRLYDADELGNVCANIMDGMFKSTGARVETLDVVWPGDDSEQESATWTTMERLEIPASTPRMAWIPCGRGKYLVNIDAISAIWFSGDGSGVIYLKGSESPLEFEPGGADKLVSMMDVVNADDC